MESEPRSRVLAAAGPLVVLGYFLAVAADGLNAYFTVDDGLNVTLVVPADHPAATVQLEKIRSQHNA